MQYLIHNLAIPGRIIEVPEFSVEVTGIDTWVDDHGVLRGKGTEEIMHADYTVEYSDGSKKEMHKELIDEGKNGCNVIKILPPKDRVICKVAVVVKGGR